MVCSPQYRQRQIWAYQPVPSSSRASCGVSSTQSRQKRRNRSGRSRSKVLLGPARLTTADKSASAATMRYPRLIGNRRVKPLRLCGEARYSVENITEGERRERAIIVSSRRHRYRGINHANQICALCSTRNAVSWPARGTNRRQVELLAPPSG